MYICNTATQLGETENFSVEDHIRVVQRYVGNIFLHVLANNNFDVEVPTDWATKLVSMQTPTVTTTQHYAIKVDDLIDPVNPWRHHSTKLADSVMKLTKH